MKLDQKIINILRNDKLSVDEIGDKLNIKLDYWDLQDYLQNMIMQGRLRREGNPWIYNLNMRGI